MSQARAQRDRRLIQRTAALLSEDFPLDQLLERICDAVRTEFEATIAFVALADPSGALKVEASSSFGDAVPRIEARSSAHAAFAGSMPILDRGREIAVPIVHRERTLGVLAVAGSAGLGLDEDDQRMLVAIARYLALAIRNQRIGGVLTRRINFARFATLAIVCAALILSVVIGGYAWLRATRTERLAREAAVARLTDIVVRVDDYLIDAQQLNYSTAELLGNVRNDRHAVESTLLAMLRSARTPGVYGIGVWFEPYAFDGRTRLYGPYAHWTPDRHAVLTYEWMRPSYNFPSRPWYRAGAGTRGRVVFTNPYFDTDHVYVTAARAFYQRDGRLAGVVTVDSIVPSLEGSLHISLQPGEFISIATSNRTLLLTSDDADLLRYASSKAHASKVLAISQSTLEDFLRSRDGEAPAAFSRRIPLTDWTATLSIRRSILDAEARRLLAIAAISVVGIWLVAGLAIVVVWRSRRQIERARALEAAHQALETEIADRIRAEERLREYAYRDELTGLPNRAFVISQIASQFERLRLDASENVALLFIDIDRFNLINDSLGHATGDRLLSEFGARIGRHARPGDVLGRLGGDEYAMLISLQSEHDARSRAVEILQSLRHPFVISGHEFFISASIGIANGDRRYHAPEELLRDADAAMYEAKRAGRATFRVFDRSMHADALEQLALETDLRRGIERGEIFAEFQPIVALSDGTIRGFEALARWRHPTRGRVMPDTFIKLAEQCGLIVDIDGAIVAQACEAAREWVREYPQIFVSVNASAAHLARVDDLAIVRNAIKTSGVPPAAIKVEITESTVMENGEKSLAVLASLRDLGVRVVIDDFGTGYSSLSHLQSLPIEEMKIDRSFVSAMLRNEKAAEIVRAIMAISKTLHMAVTAEGVETEEQVARLARLGIEYAQGYYFGMAVDADKATRLLRTRLKRTVGI